MPELTAAGDDGSVSSSALFQLSPEVPEVKIVDEVAEEEDDLQKLLVPNFNDLPPIPPLLFNPISSPTSLQPGHDQYVHRHANGLCVIGLASSHVAFKVEGSIAAVDFNVGKSDRSEMKNAQLFESNTALCKVCTNDGFYIVRWCVKGSLLEVNERLIKQHGLLASEPEREGYIAIIMPRPADWLKAKASLMSFEEYKRLKRDIH